MNTNEERKISTALVTGGSRGLGLALGLELAKTGTRVVLVAREAEPLHRAVARIRDEGGEAHGISADVADPQTVHSIAGQAAALVGPIDLLVNNASTLGPVPLRLLLDTDCEDFSRVLEANLVGPFRLIKALAGSMVLRGSGSIVNITSDASVEAYSHWGAYAVSKAALDHLGRILAVEMEGTGVQVLTIDPGEMNTRMHADAMPEADLEELADPRHVAARIVSLLLTESTARIRSGTRLQVRAGIGVTS